MVPQYIMKEVKKALPSRERITSAGQSPFFEGRVLVTTITKNGQVKYYLVKFPASRDSVTLEQL